MVGIKQSSGYKSIKKTHPHKDELTYVLTDELIESINYITYKQVRDMDIHMNNCRQLSHRPSDNHR